jgi:hypothetical protein
MGKILHIEKPGLAPSFSPHLPTFAATKVLKGVVFSFLPNLLKFYYKFVRKKQISKILQVCNAFKT